MDQRALARAAGADDGQHFARVDFQIDVVQNLAPLFAVSGIGEADTLEANAAGKLWQNLGARLLANVIFEIHEVEDFATKRRGPAESCC